MRASLWRFFLVTLVLSGACVLALELLVGTLVPLFYGTEFTGAVPLTRVLLVAAVFISCRRVLADGARGCGRPVLGSVAEAASWFSLLVLLPLLVPPLGANGVAIAVVLSSVISFLVLAIALWAAPAAGPEGRQARRRRRVQPAATSGMSWGGVLTWLLVAGGAGAVLPFLSTLTASLVTVTLAAGCLALAARRRLRRTLRSTPPRPAEEDGEIADVAGHSSGEFRTARALYYLGLLFVGQATFRPASGLTLSDLFFVASFFATCLALISSRRARMPGLRPRSLVTGGALFAVGVLMSSASLEAPAASLAYGLRFLYVTLVWFWVGTAVLRNVRHIAWAVSLWVISIGLGGLAAVAQLFLGDVVPGTSPVFGRMTGMALHINDLGGMAGIALPAAVALVARPPGAVRGRRTALAIVVLIGGGLLLSGSVGGLLAATVGAAVYTTASRVRGRTVVTALVILAGGVLLVSAQHDAGAPGPLERASRVTGPEDDPSATLWSRVETNRAALEAIADRPIIGHGLGQSVPETGFQVHNVVLGLWYEGGFFALTGIVAILTGLVLTGLRVVRSARSGDEWQLAIGLVAAFSSFLVFAMGAPVLFQRYAWMPAALLVALRAQQIRTAKSSASAPPLETSPAPSTSLP